MQGTVDLYTEHLILRRYLPEDASVLHRYFGQDEAMYQYSGWNPYATPAMAADTVQDYIRSYQDPAFYGWAVVMKGNGDNAPAGKMVGTIGAYDYDPECGRIEVGLSVRRDHWGQGIGREALQAVLTYLTQEEGILCVTAWCAADNIGSASVMKHAGMQQYGLEPDALRIGEQVYDRLLFEYRIPEDLTFSLRQGTFNYRVGAVILHKGKLLLMHNEEEPYFYTVGGRVRFNETTEETVIREVREEIGVDLEIDRFLFFQEQFFDGKVTGTHIHEIGVYYLMKDSPALDHIECHSVTARGAVEELHWIPLEDCKSFYIVPESIAARLSSLPRYPEHIIEIDER